MESLAALEAVGLMKLCPALFAGPILLPLLLLRLAGTDTVFSLKLVLIPVVTLGLRIVGPILLPLLLLLLAGTELLVFNCTGAKGFFRGVDFFKSLVRDLIALVYPLNPGTGLTFRTVLTDVALFRELLELLKLLLEFDRSTRFLG